MRSDALPGTAMRTVKVEYNSMSTVVLEELEREMMLPFYLKHLVHVNVRESDLVSESVFPTYHWYDGLTRPLHIQKSGAVGRMTGSATVIQKCAWYAHSSCVFRPTTSSAYISPLEPQQLPYQVFNSYCQLPALVSITGSQNTPQLDAPGYHQHQPLFLSSTCIVTYAGAHTLRSDKKTIKIHWCCALLHFLPFGRYHIRASLVPGASACTMPNYAQAGIDSLRALYTYYNVESPTSLSQSPIPETIRLNRVIQRNAKGIDLDGVFPTHVLLLRDSSDLNPVWVPVDCRTLASKFRITGLPTRLLPPRPIASRIIVPLHLLEVPHLPSAALLFLHALLCEQHPANQMAREILPPEVVEEFPACGPMFDILSDYSDDDLRDMALFNQGLWKNVLATGCTDASILKTARAAWTIVAEARKMKRSKLSTPSGEVSDSTPS